MYFFFLNFILYFLAQVSPIAGAPVATALICVYTENYLDIADVKRVRNTLRQMGKMNEESCFLRRSFFFLSVKKKSFRLCLALGFTRKMSYKPDIYTYLDIYQNNPWRIPPTVYTEWDL